VTPTSQWVDYYCDVNTYLQAPLPVGSIVEARTPGDLLVGQFAVTTAGKYGFMPVYRASTDFAMTALTPVIISSSLLTAFRR